MRWSENREQFILSFFKMGQPRHFFVYLRSFQAKFYRKIVILSGIRTRIIRVEGELSDHLTITTAQKFILCTQGSEFKLTWARAAEFSLMKERLNERSIDVKIERHSTTWRDRRRQNDVLVRSFFKSHSTTWRQKRRRFGKSKIWRRRNP